MYLRSWYLKVGWDVCEDIASHQHVRAQEVSAPTEDILPANLRFQWYYQQPCAYAHPEHQRERFRLFNTMNFLEVRNKRPSMLLPLPLVLAAVSGEGSSQEHSRLPRKCYQYLWKHLTCMPITESISFATERCAWGAWRTLSFRFWVSVLTC